jgi:hypothetical protein
MTDSTSVCWKMAVCSWLFGAGCLHLVLLQLVLLQLVLFAVCSVCSWFCLQLVTFAVGSVAVGSHAVSTGYWLN